MSVWGLVIGSRMMMRRGRIVGRRSSSSSRHGWLWQLLLLLCAQIYGSKFSNSISNDHQLILWHVLALALDYSLQVQQCLQSGLFTSIKRILCKFRPIRNDKLLDIMFQLVYAYPLWWSAIDLPRRRLQLLLMMRITPNRRSRLRCCTRWNSIWALELFD